MYDSESKFIGRALLLALLTVASAASAEPLRYGAYFAGAQVGTAEIHVRVNADAYEIAGEAWALGVIRTATQWRSDFSATGRFADGEVIPESYQFSSTRRGDRTRSTQVAHGVVETFRNGRPRDTSEAPDGLDVLTALFFPPKDCDSLDALHTGTSTYQIKLKEHHVPAPNARTAYVERCEFEVVDEDGDSYRVGVEMAELNGHRIPSRIDVGGFITGTVRLLERPRNFGTARLATAEQHP
jgi:hypothetical protein